MSLESQLRQAKRDRILAKEKWERLKEASNTLNDLEDELTASRNKLENSIKGAVWEGKARLQYDGDVESTTEGMRNANKGNGKLEGPKDNIDAAKLALPLEYLDNLISRLERDIAKLAADVAEDIADTLSP